MTVTIDYNAPQGVTVGTFRGDSGLDDFFDAAQRIWELQEGGSARVLWDLLDAQVNLSADEVRRLSDFTKQGSPYTDARIAFVVAKDLEFGLVRMFEAMRETDVLHVRVFRDRSRALAWLSGESD